MILIEIKKYLSDKKTANLQELAFHFNQPPETMRQMVAHWVRKGKVMVLPKPLSCGTGCTQCKPEWAEEYCWK